MLSRFDATLAGKRLLKEIPELMVLDIQYTPATIEDATYHSGYTSFAHITDRKYSGAQVQISVEIHEYDPVVRNEVCQRMLEWAMRGGELKTSDRPGQKLNVVCTNAPYIASALKWTDRVNVKFSALENPFWVAEDAQKFTIYSGGTGQVSVNGCVDSARVSATITSGTPTSTGTQITSLTLTCGSTTITLSNIDVARGYRILIDYDSYGFLRIRTSNGTNLMKNRTGSDELLLPCGKTSTVKVSANTAVTCALEVRGNWL